MAQQGRGPATGQGQPARMAVWGPMPQLRPRGCPARSRRPAGWPLVWLTVARSQPQARRGRRGCPAPGCPRRKAMQPLGGKTAPGSAGRWGSAWRSAESRRQGRPGQHQGWVKQGLRQLWQLREQEVCLKRSRGLSRSAKPRAASSSRAFCKVAIPGLQRLVRPQAGERLKEESAGWFGLSSNTALPPQRNRARRCQWRYAGHFAHILPVCAPPAAAGAQTGLNRTPDQHWRNSKTDRPPVGRPMPSGPKGNDQPQTGWLGHARLNLSGPARASRRLIGSKLRVRPRRSQVEIGSHGRGCAAAAPGPIEGVPPLAQAASSRLPGHKRGLIASVVSPFPGVPSDRQPFLSACPFGSAPFLPAVRR